MGAPRLFRQAAGRRHGGPSAAGPPSGITRPSLTRAPHSPEAAQCPENQAARPQGRPGSLYPLRLCLQSPQLSLSWSTEARLLGGLAGPDLAHFAPGLPGALGFGVSHSLHADAPRSPQRAHRGRSSTQARLAVQPVPPEAGIYREPGPPPQKQPLLCGFKELWC